MLSWATVAGSLPLIWRLCLVSPAAEEDRPDSRFSEQKEPPSEDQASGAEEAGAGRLRPGNTSRCPPSEVNLSKHKLKSGDRRDREDNILKQVNPAYTHAFQTRPNRTLLVLPNFRLNPDPRTRL